MKTYWENDGQPNDEGTFVAVIDMGDGSGIQRFEGSTQVEVANKLMVAQGNATAKIRQLSGKPAPVVPDLAPDIVEFRPRSLTADERFKVATEVTDASRAPEAIRTVIEADLGAPLKLVADRINKDEQERLAREAAETSREWAAENPTFFQCQHNAITMKEFMVLKSMAVTKKNLSMAFEYLSEHGLLIAQPANAEEEPEEAQPAPGGLPANNQPAATTRPRGSASTGLRAGDSSAAAPSKAAAPKYTKQQIEAMPEVEYRERYQNEAGFAALVDKLYASPTAG